MHRVVKPVACELYFLPVQTRVPLKLGRETLTSVICARVKMTVEDAHGKRANGWGETPLSVQWVWPSELPYHERLASLQKLCVDLTSAWASFKWFGHPLEIGIEFQRDALPGLTGAIPHLAALVCCSPFDIALHDAFGNLHGVDIYQTHNSDWISHDLAYFFDDAHFAGKYPADFLRPRENQLPRFWPARRRARPACRVTIFTATSFRSDGYPSAAAGLDSTRWAAGVEDQASGK